MKNNFNKLGLISIVLGLLFSVMNTAVRAQICTPAASGLASWWPGDGDALDLRSRNTGVLTGTTFVGGQNGQGYRFAPGGIFSADGSGSLDISGDKITLEAWVKLESNGAHPASSFTGFMGKNNFPVQNYGLVFESGLISGTGPQLAANQWQVEYIFVNSAGTRVHNQRTHVVVTIDGNYHHFALTYDGSGAPTENVKIYVDGVLQVTDIGDVLDQMSGNIKSSPATPFTISAGNSAVSIDETSVYARTLSDAEIAAISRAGTAGKCKPTATVAPLGLTAWLAGDGDGADITGNGFNGVLHPDTVFVAGRAGQGFGLNGTTARVEIAGAPAFSPGSGSFAMDAWIKTAKNDADLQEVVCRYGPGGTTNITSSDVCMFVQDGRFSGEIRASSVGAAPQTLTSTVIVADGTFHHVVMQRDTAAGTMSIFVDGIEQSAALNAQSGGTITFTDDKPVVIGASVTFNSEAREQFFTGVIDEVDYFNRALTPVEVTSIVGAGLAGKLKVSVTPVGFSNAGAGLGDLGRNPGPNPFSPQAVNSSVGDATVTFAGVTTAGLTQEIPLDPSALPPLPPGFTPAGLYYDVATSSIFTGSPVVCFNLPSVTSAFARVRIMHLEAGAWQDRTAPVNSLPIICTTGLSSLSPFAIAFAPPTAALVTVSGTVTTPGGSGIFRATLSLRDDHGNIKQVTTNPLGYYRFDNVAVGGQYILSVQSKQRQYADNPRLVTVNDTVINQDFTSLP